MYMYVPIMNLITALDCRLKLSKNLAYVRYTSNHLYSVYIRHDLLYLHNGMYPVTVVNLVLFVGMAT